MTHQEILKQHVKIDEFTKMIRDSFCFNKHAYKINVQVYDGTKLPLSLRFETSKGVVEEQQYRKGVISIYKL